MCKLVFVLFVRRWWDLGKGYKSYSRSKPLTIQEFDREKAWWSHREQTEFAWPVPAPQIIERNYNLDCKNPHQIAVDHGDPAALMAEFVAISEEVKGEHLTFASGFIERYLSYYGRADSCPFR